MSVVLMTRPLVGRERELESVFRLAAEVDSGGGSLVVRGEAGIGKSALLERIGDELCARGWRVLRTSGTPSERQLPFAGLQKLLRPMMGELSRLYAPQRDALLCAFGLVDGSLSGIFLVALATLDLLAEAATSGPVLVLVDDWHWLDRSTGDVLGFVARRLEWDPVLLLAGARDLDDPLGDAGLPELHLSRLDAEASRALLEATAPQMTASSRRLVLDAAAGNPLSLIELPKALEDSVGGGETAGQLPMTDRLERAFAVRALELPEAVGDLLLLVAVNDSGSLAEVLAAAAAMRPDAGGDALDVARSSGLIVVEESTIRFRHPLVGSAIHRSASLVRRQAAHAALAEVLFAEPDRSIWHRAASVLGPDEDLAGELEDVGLRAQRRGALDTAIVALRRGAEISAAPAPRGRRLLGAAELALELGEVDLGGRLLRSAEGLELEGPDRVRLEWIRELSDERVLGGAERVEALIELAERAHADGDGDLALQLLGRAGSRCWTIDLGPGPGRRVIGATDHMSVDEADPRVLAIRASALPFECGAEVIAVLDRPGVTRRADVAGLHLLGVAAARVGEFARAEAYLTASTGALREQGRLVELAQVLGLQAWAALRCSRWGIASTAAGEAARLAEETRQPRLRADALVAQATLASMRGDASAAARIATEAEAVAIGTGSTVTFALIQNVRSMIANAAGRALEAFEALWHIYEPRDPAHQPMQACWAIGSLAEYAVASGHRQEAADELAKLEPLVAKTPSTGVHVGVRYARALLADPGDAESFYLAALARDLGDWPFNDARVLLGYGAWLRRQRRIKDARTPLRSALEIFDRLGALGWADRARGELRAAGEDTVRRPRAAWYQLTPQEMQIARLVAEGLSNKEIGRRLYLSHRTVASHLYRMFPKLGVSSRAQLARVASEHAPGSSSSNS